MIVALRMFAAAREAAGRASDTCELPDGATLDDALAVATARYGAPFAEVLAVSGVWVDGDEPAAGGATPLADGVEIAVLPPVSGGAADGGRTSPARRGHPPRGR